MITGEAAGVPFVALEPAGGARPDAPVVVAWHLLDAPRTERAFAAALPLDGLDAWRFYLGLPKTGARLPAGGLDEVMRLGYEDAVRHLHGAINLQAGVLYDIKMEYCEFYVPVGMISSFCASWGALGVNLAWMPQIYPTVKITPLKGARWILKNTYNNFLVELPLTFYFACDQRYALIFKPFYEYWSENIVSTGQSRAR